MAEQTFNEFTKQARIEFVNYINSLEWNNELRTKCEDLLIAYDQMKTKCDGMEDSNENSGLHLQRVSGSLPTKDEVVSELYARVYNGDYEKRNVMRNNMQDCYYSGYLDCFDKLTGNDR